ncbi:MAG: 1-acyl-sn-glycerol-3-phosphate acyltransferase [Defluviitaleaceae bacterium]|nr:1-acyl-sn-glycerol-3-phosphate acyltransferase [Defluviitaleaceae bacterium]MCL2261907.1 1-acyl-sn-glycerol-3-phosphate acyltransferase [Defluviitaleaceae bacterium]
MFYKTCRVIAWIIGHIIYRFEVTGRENIPKDGAFLICANHIHAFDPIVLGIFTKRIPRFMAKKELFKTRLSNWFFRNYGAYPIDRQAAADMTAFRTTMDILKSGDGLIIFSQGTRMKDFDNAKSGVAVFALKSGAPIIPTGIRASYKLFSKVHVHYGEPITMDEYAGEKVKTELVEKVMSKVIGSVTKLAAEPS